MVNIKMADMRLMLALERKRTTDTYGTLHFCKTHDQLVDKLHIDECTHLKSVDSKITDLVNPISEV
jgi:hypothetical protein